jgi:hypothetical protein
MKKLILIMLLIFCSKILIAQNTLYSEKTIISMWNGNSNDWTTLLERNDAVTFTLTKDHSMFLMYCEGSG